MAIMIMLKCWGSVMALSRTLVLVENTNKNGTRELCRHSLALPLGCVSSLAMEQMANAEVLATCAFVMQNTNAAGTSYGLGRNEIGPAPFRGLTRDRPCV